MSRKNNRATRKSTRHRYPQGISMAQPTGHANNHHTNRRNSESRQKQVARLAVRDGWWCHWCKCPLSYEAEFSNNPIACYPRYPTLDHLIEKRVMGSNRDENCVLSCQPCNNARSNERKTDGQTPTSDTT